MMNTRGFTRLSSYISPRYSSTGTAWKTLSDCIKAPAAGVRCKSIVSLGGDKQQEEKQALGAKDDKGIVSYWDLEPTKVSKEDGAPWKWTCFRRRYGCRAMMLETVAAVPGMVGGMLLHCKSLRRFENSGGWIKALLEEAENERIFFNAYFLGYIISPKFAHRVVGYLEEEAIHSYTEFLKELDNGNIENVPAPPIAIDYWRLPPNSPLRDIVLAVRADEAHHRDVNHFASDIHDQGRQLKEALAPLDYH
ncbi:hypothetical protein V6N11_011952 [Hibiscus sabdariffa]|uniref:Ubiquinol oxidase n=1 Tax=Hibiscus sabdariffa TaxID=183260 RepID=A0ABR2S9S0_9ROSI